MRSPLINVKNTPKVIFLSLTFGVQFLIVFNLSQFPLKNYCAEFADIPPSIRTTVPSIKYDLSEPKKTIKSAISSGVA